MFNVGPGCTWNEQFDLYCIFGNEVEVDLYQMIQLKSYAEELPKPPIKSYICRIEDSFIVPRQGKMVSILV